MLPLGVSEIRRSATGGQVNVATQVLQFVAFEGLGTDASV